MTNSELLTALSSCRVGVLAKLLGLSERRCRELGTEHGWRVGPGRYDALRAVSDYLARHSERGAVLDLAQERALLAKAQREKLDLDMAERRRELLRSPDVEFAWADAWTKVRTGMMQLPGSVVPAMLAAAWDYGTQHRILSNAIRAELERLAADAGYTIKTADEPLDSDTV